MIRQTNNDPFSQRQLRVGELIKQSLGQILLRDEAKVPGLETKNITVTEVRMSPDLKNAKAYVIPLGGKDTEKTVKKILNTSSILFMFLSISFLLRIFLVSSLPEGSPINVVPPPSNIIG